MSQTIHLLLPCTVTAQAEKKQDCRSSVWIHAITALVAGILLGAGAAFAAYMATDGLMMWTIVAGAGMALTTSIAAYVILRFALGQKISEASQKQSASSPAVIKNAKVNSISDQQLQRMINPVAYFLTQKRQDLRKFEELIPRFEAYAADVNAQNQFVVMNRTPHTVILDFNDFGKTNGLYSNSLEDFCTYLVMTGRVFGYNESRHLYIY